MLAWVAAGRRRRLEAVRREWRVFHPRLGHTQPARVRRGHVLQHREPARLGSFACPMPPIHICETILILRT